MSFTRRALLAALATAPLAARAEPAPPAAASLARPVAPARDASALVMTDAEGAAVPLSRFAGEIVVLNLWAPWCLPCRREMPSLARLAAQGFQVLPLGFDWRGPRALARFYEEIGVTTLPVLLGDGDNLHATLGLDRLPSTAILDRAGQHIFTVEGEAQWDDPATLDWLKSL